MWLQEGRNWHLGEVEYSIDFENTGKNTKFKIYFKS